jgi:hypothetical protein
MCAIQATLKLLVIDISNAKSAHDPRDEVDFGTLRARFHCVLDIYSQSVIDQK